MSGVNKIKEQPNGIHNWENARPIYSANEHHAALNKVINRMVVLVVLAFTSGLMLGVGAMSYFN